MHRSGSSFDDYNEPEYSAYSQAGFDTGEFGAVDDVALSSGDDTRPRILLMGTRRSGKSSIQKVVFHKMSPHETLFLESTNQVRVKDIATSALVQFQLLDFPGNFDPKFESKNSKMSADTIFDRAGALVFVIDAQDDETYDESIDYFIQMAKIAYEKNPSIGFDVLIHKVDGDAYLSDDHKTACQHEIKKKISDGLEDMLIRPSFHLTSIYDHTIFEAFSKIVQKLIPQLGLESLLDGLIANCKMEKAFLFDVLSKIYVATDSNPVDMQTYELCSDMIDVVIDVSCIYGLKGMGDVLAYDADSASVIKLSSNYILYLREVNKYLALVCLMRNDSFTKQGLVEYNFACFKKAISELLEAKNKLKTTTSPRPENGDKQH